MDCPTERKYQLQNGKYKLPLVSTSFCMKNKVREKKMHILSRHLTLAATIIYKPEKKKENK